MTGAMLMTGLCGFGGAVALGLIATGTSPEDSQHRGSRQPDGRGLAIILLAICQGEAVLGTVVGLLAIFLAGVTDPAAGVLAVVPATIGALVGLFLVVRHWRASDPTTSGLIVLYILATVVLSAVVALLALFIEGPTIPLVDWPFSALGLVSAVATIGIGRIGMTAVPAMRDVEGADAKAIANTQLARVLPFQLSYVAANAIAIALVVLA